MSRPKEKLLARQNKRIHESSWEAKWEKNKELIGGILEGLHLKDRACPFKLLNPPTCGRDSFLWACSKSIMMAL